MPIIIETLRKIPFFTDAETREKKRLVAQLNHEFSHGNNIVETSEMLQRLDKPILIDFNNVLFNNRKPLIHNPDALLPFKELAQIGTPIVLTAGYKWDLVHSCLVTHKFWSDRVLLICGSNYENVVYNSPSSTLVLLRRQYEQMAAASNMFSEAQRDTIDRNPDSLWEGNIQDKKIAFAFMKPYLIPLIDNDPLATTDNPGMLGQTLTSWESFAGYTGYAESKDLVRLRDVVPTIKTHYAQYKVT